jgi:hypothetical protein
MSWPGWGSPIGLGIFILCFGVFVYLASRARPGK